MKTRKIKLYVWENTLQDYTCGVIFALAYSVKEARAQVIKKFEKDGLDKDSAKECLAEPYITSRPEGFFCYGGG